MTIFKYAGPIKFEELWFTKEGAYAPKNAKYLRISGTDSPNIILIDFDVPLRSDVGPGSVTMSIPLTMSDAANLLANLMEAQQQGLLPAFAKPQKATDVN